MLFKIENVDESNFQDTPNPCRCCLYWQTNGEFGEQTLKPEMETKKRKWFNKVAKEFGSCIKIAYLDNVPIGFIQYAPAKFFPRLKEYAAGPSSEDAVFIACLYISNRKERGKGLGTKMLENLIAELKEREFKAVETFARTSSENNPSGPLKLYLKHNFKIKNDKDDFPLVRLEF
jgi:ribosomal protein S18 acetylase RimI-like enzyme